MKKGLLIVVIIILVAVGAYFYWQSSNQKTEVASNQTPGSNEPTTEPTIEQNIQYAKTTLQSIQTALESWKIDHKSYPDTLYALTTPIAYITSIPKDPFTQDQVFSYKKINDEDFMLWSVGPDGKDDGGRILFYEKNGVTSPGDIVRTPTIH